MNIEKLERFDCTQSSNGYGLGTAYMLLDSDGDYVLHSVARAREDALLDALKAFLDLDDGDEPFAWKHALEFNKASDLIRQIESTR